MYEIAAGLWYAGAVTGVAGTAMDSLIPRIKVVAMTDDFPCAGHGCACRTAEDCRTNCCCFGGPRPAPARRACHAAPKPAECPHHAAQSRMPVPLTSVAQQECSGGGPKAPGSLRIRLHLPLARHLPLAMNRGGHRLRATGDRVSVPVRGAAPFKVPWTQADLHALS